MRAKPITPKITPRQIVGIVMAPETARDVKAEAKRRGVSLRVFFAELWNDRPRKTAIMEKKIFVRHREQVPRQIVGFVMSPETARDVKAEADRRNVSLKVLFAELWAHYTSKSPKPRRS